MNCCAELGSWSKDIGVSCSRFVAVLQLTSRQKAAMRLMWLFFMAKVWMCYYYRDKGKTNGMNNQIICQFLKMECLKSDVFSSLPESALMDLWMAQLLPNSLSNVLL